MQEMLKFILNGAGFQTIIARNSQEGFEKATTINPDLIIADIMLSGPTGIKAIQEIKSDPASQHIPVVVLSAYDNQELVDGAIAAGAEVYLRKNIIPERLIEVIERRLT
jgi:CheY-like chemotaxis protein